MQTKYIVFPEPKVAELRTRELSPLKTNEVRIQLVRSTISPGSERANLIGDPNCEASAAPRVVFPRGGGYSAAGYVVEIGENVSRFQVGDRVAAYGTSHAQYCNVPEDRTLKIPDALGFDEAALLYIANFSLAAIRKCRLEVGESAIVMGLGVLGMFAVKLLRITGAYPVIAVDPVESKRELAMENGADYAFDPFAPDFVSRVKAVTADPEKPAEYHGTNVAIEVTGNGKALDQALDCMAKFGRVALLGCTRNSDFTIDYYRKIHFPGIHLIGAHTWARPQMESHEACWTALDDMKAMIKLLCAKRISFREMIEEVHLPTEAPAVYDRLANDRSFPLVQFDWTQMEDNQ